MTSVPAVLISDQWTTGDCITELLLLWLGSGLTVLAVLFVRCQTPYLPHLQALTTGARTRAPLRDEPVRLAGLALTLLHRGGLVQVSTLARRSNREICPQLLDADDVPPLGSAPAR